MSVPDGGTVCGAAGVFVVDGSDGTESGITGPLLPADGWVLGESAGVKPLAGTGLTGTEGGVDCIPGPPLERLDFILAGAGLVTDGGFEAFTLRLQDHAMAHAKIPSVFATALILRVFCLVSRKMTMNHEPSGKAAYNWSLTAARINARSHKNAMKLLYILGKVSPFS